jgi:hypothetical protein
MVRQFWIYLLEEDEAELWRAIEAVSPGLSVVPGRFVRGSSAEADLHSRLLRGVFEGLEFPPLSAREVQKLAFHQQASQVVVTHPVLEGPLSGTRSIDDVRSDGLLMVRPLPNRNLLEPTRLLASTHVMRAEKKIRKTPSFTVWVGALLRSLRKSFPRSGVDYIHVGPRALAWSEAGHGQLSYLYKPVAARPDVSAQTKVTTPQKR